MRTRARRRADAAAALLALAAAPLACGDDPTTPPHRAELDRARLATARYRDVSRAVADGYADAGIVIQGMGHHYVNAALLDDRFDPDRPEILVYVPDERGMQLVAIEYAVPLDLAAAAPSGFAGGADTWDRNTTYGLWTLHAWLFLDNPGGTFAATNPRVRLAGAAAAHGHGR